jgi:hypothetical protein
MVMLGEVVKEPVRTRVELSVTQPVEVHVGVGLAEDDVERPVLEEEEGVAAVEELDNDGWVEVIVKVDEAIEGLLLDDETTVCRVVTENIEMEEESDDEELLRAMVLVV